MRAAGVVLAVAIAVVEPATAQVTFERLRSSASEPGNWLTYSGSYGSWRYSPLDQITPANVADLRVAWVHQAEDPGRPGLMETTPLVDGGVLYTTDPPSTVVAIDTKTGSRIWRWSKRMPDDLRALGFPPTNRGVALLGDQAFVGTMDGWLYALDAKTGAERWSVQVGDNATGHSITLAPLALDGMVIVGISGGEAGIRGFIDAYDAETGKLRWRFWTIPGPGEPGPRHLDADELAARRRSDLAHRLLRRRPRPPLLGHRQPGTGLERRRAAGRQPLHLLGARDRAQDRKAALALPVHAARRPRLGRQPDSDPARRRGRRPVAPPARHRQPQRVLLPARSRDRRVPARVALRQADLGRRHRRQGQAEGAAGHRADRSRERWCGPASRAPPTGSVLRTARRRTSSTFRCARWAPTTTKAKPSTRPAPTSPAAASARSAAIRPRARSARSTPPPASCAGSGSCSRRRGRA